MSTPYIDASAQIDPSAHIGQDVRIGPFCVIGPGVTIGDRCVLKSHVVIQAETTVGTDNVFQSGAIIGCDSQARDFDSDQPSTLVIGNHNHFHSFCTINRGSNSSATRIGHHNIIMAYAHIAHDCIIGNHVVLVNNATLGGHVEVHDYANVGCMTMVHQFCRIGEHAFMPRGVKISKDVMPYVIISGEPPKVYGLNAVGLTRRGFDETDMVTLKEAYRIIFRESLKQEEVIERLQALKMASDCAALDPMLQLLRTSERGIVR